MATPTLDEYMISYHPYRGGTNPKHKDKSDSQTLVYIKRGVIKEDRKDKFIKKISDWLMDEVKEIDKNPVVVAIAPGHEKDDDPTGFMHDIVEKLAEDHPRRVIDGGQQLIRTKTVKKSATTPGFRDMKKHEGTIEINGKPDNKGKVVIILDDVWTSGSTLSACKKVMRDTKPKEVKLFAIGKTVS